MLSHTGITVSCCLFHGPGLVSSDRGKDWRGSASSGYSWAGQGWSVWSLASQYHFLSPGPSRFALFLLCSMETLLSSHMAPTHQLPPSDVRKIILELQPLSRGLLEDYVSALQISFPSHFFKMPSIAPRRSQLFLDLKLGLWIHQEGKGNNETGYNGLFVRVGGRD